MIRTLLFLSMLGCVAETSAVDSCVGRGECDGGYAIACSGPEPSSLSTPQVTCAPTNASSSKAYPNTYCCRRK